MTPTEDPAPPTGIDSPEQATGDSPGPTRHSPSVRHTRRRMGQADLYPDEVLIEQPGSSPGGGAAILLAILVVLLLIVMITGWNNDVPYLHPSTKDQVTVAGDRTTYSYLFLHNGTRLNTTLGELCPNCPFDVAPGADFSYPFDLVNPMNQSIELTSMTAAPPFQVVSYAPSENSLLPGGLSQELTLTLLAPSNAGVYAVSLGVGVDVS
jgi:hypothetical protein